MTLVSRILLSLNIIWSFTYCKAADSPAQITLFPQQKEQVIDGFGVAQAGWADKVYEHHKRTQIMNSLFGKDGLCLSILRGEVFPQSPVDTTDESLKRKAQLWISHFAQDSCKVDKLIFSTWTPPAYMKSNGKVSHGFLKPEYYQAFADYLVAFCKAYEETGLKVYAISPSNEPGYEAPWNSCKWTPEQMGNFLTKHLAPTFKQHCPNVQIIYGENPTWSTARHPMLQGISSEKFVNAILDQYPEIKGYPYIAAGHGYDIPLSTYFKNAKDVATPIIPYTKAVERGQNVWVTEISSIDPLDAGIENGLAWAAKFHKYLTEASVNAFVWWGGAMPTSNNESLIVLDKDKENYSFTKRYETFGNYTRYIPVGSRRIQTENRNLPESVLISAFMKHKQYTAVAVNPETKPVTCRIVLKDTEIKGDIETYTTTQTERWHKGYIIPKKGYYLVTLPPKSVITLVGNIN